MAMCGAHGEEAARESTKEPAEEPSRSVTTNDSPSLNEATPCADIVSPLSSLLSCRDIAPTILEHEKAFLVIKEHDYAKAPDRPELLQLSTLLASGEDRSATFSTKCSNSELRPELTSLTRKAMKDVLLSCREDVLGLRGSFARVEGESTCRQLREVVSLQVSLIREQQEQLHMRDGELNSARKEKEQLEARLERMERRLAILQKHSRHRQSATKLDTPSSTTTPKRRHSRAELVAMSERHDRSRSSSVDTNRTRSRPSSHAGTPVPADERDGAGSAKRTAKKRPRPMEEEDSVGLKRTKRNSVQMREIRTRLEYNGLQLPSLPSASTTTDIECNHVCETSRKDINSFITVPPWSLGVGGSTSLTADNPKDTEDLSDEAFLKRHKKPEEDEKRRKRWDIQRARALREHEELLRKYMMKGGGQGQKEKKAKEKVVTFLPKLEELEVMEIMDTVTVSAFGRPLPLLPPSEFELTWFDLDARAARETVRTTRSKAKARQSIGSSSTEEL